MFQIKPWQVLHKLLPILVFALPVFDLSAEESKVKGEKTKIGTCEKFKVEAIPELDELDLKMPMEQMSITQEYNTDDSNSKMCKLPTTGARYKLYELGEDNKCDEQYPLFCHAVVNGEESWTSSINNNCQNQKPFCQRQEVLNVNGSTSRTAKYYPVDDPMCPEHEKAHGHNGIDISSTGRGIGQAGVYAVSKGFVVYSAPAGEWGEAIVYAVRFKYSHEIFTFHYYHLQGPPQEVWTSRKVVACDWVQPNQELAKEGRTGEVSGPHLHFTVKRWKSLSEIQYALKKPQGLLHHQGYNSSITNAVEKTLSPYHLLFEKFTDLDCGATDTLCQQNIKAQRAMLLQARRIGIDFGKFDGSFGWGDQLTRGDSVRWLKVGAQLSTSLPASPTFTDVQPFPSGGSPLPGFDAYPYVETLITKGVINKDGDCDSAQAGKQFCPMLPRTRAEYLKMIVETFFHDEFQKYLNSGLAEFYAQTAYNEGHFQDDAFNLAGMGWAIPYVYFAAYYVNPSLITKQKMFRPNEAILRGEGITLLMRARSQKGFNTPVSPCDEKFCSPQVCLVKANFFSQLPEAVCQKPPECDPNEGDGCEYGGSVDGTGGAGGDTGAAGSASGGKSGQSGNAGVGGTSSGGAGQAGSTSGSSGTAGTGGQAGSNQAGTSGAGGNTGSAGTSSCECTSGICCNGCGYYPASTQCGSTQTYRCSGTNPGDDAQVANVFQFCSGSSSLCNGAITQDAWQTYEACGSTELCLETGGLPYCSAPACSDVFKTTTVQDPCYSNPQNPNSPELCLEMNQISGSTWEYRICKGNGSGFSNTIKHRLTDQNINHPKQWNWKTYSAGASCTSWVTVDMSYLTQNGTSQGAGLQAEVLSPSSCVESSCTLRTGQVGVYKTCE